MSLTAHIQTLQARKSELEEQIRFEASRPMPNFQLLGDLKKKKLRVKEKIYQLAHPAMPDLDCA